MYIYINKNTKSPDGAQRNKLQYLDHLQTEILRI